MKNFLIKNIKSIIEFVYKHMEQGSGHMILLTSMTGILLSCLAQSGAILLNKKYMILAEKKNTYTQEQGGISNVRVYSEYWDSKFDFDSGDCTGCIWTEKSAGCGQSTG